MGSNSVKLKCAAYEDFSPTSSSASFIIQTTATNEVTAADRVEINFVAKSVTGHLFASKTIAPGVDAVSSNTVLTNDSPSVIVVDTTQALSRYLIQMTY